MRKPDARGVSIADDVTNEIGMGRTEEEIPDVFHDGFKDGGMGAFTSGLDGSCSQLRREVEFFATTRCKESNNHSINLVSLAITRQNLRKYFLTEGLFCGVRGMTFIGGSCETVTLHSSRSRLVFWVFVLRFPWGDAGGSGWGRESAFVAGANTLLAGFFGKWRSDGSGSRRRDLRCGRRSDGRRVVSTSHHKFWNAVLGGVNNVKVGFG